VRPRDAIFLVGFMGAGKTTAGRALARLLGWCFIDLDEQIVAAEGRSIPRIFTENGERYFRRLETQLLGSLRDRPRIVVACGGGTYAQAKSRALIDSMGRAVWIRISLEMALGRCAAGGTERPLFKDAVQAEALYLARLPSYRAAALHVDAEGLTPEEIAERIARSME
jgi:shikimate kinase